MGTRVCSSKGSWPGHRPFTDTHHRAIISNVWGVPESHLPADPGPGPVGIVNALEDGVDAVYAVATNPAAGLPDAANARKRLENTFLVVQDAFHSETVEVADVVLPAATWGETEGTAINMERTISRVRAATEPPPGVKTDLEWIGLIAANLVPGLFETSLEPADVFAEFAMLTAGTPADCSGISYDRLETDVAVRWPAPKPDVSGGYRYYSVDEDGEHWQCHTETGRAQFSSGEARALPEPVDGAYPLTLTTARAPDAYNTGVRTRGDSPPIARVSPATAAALATELEARGAHRYAQVVSRRASVLAILEEDAAIPDGVVWLPIHHPAVNDLTVAAIDPRSKEPNYKQCAVRLESPTETHQESKQ